MTTTNLGMPEITAAQNNKEVTANAQAEWLDSFLTETWTVDFTAGNVDLTGVVDGAGDSVIQKYRRFVPVNIAADQILTLPATKRGTIIIANTSAWVITVKVGTTESNVPAGDTAQFEMDGTADGLTALGQKSGVGIAANTGTTITLALSDSGKYLRCSNAAAITLTVPAAASVAFPIGTTVAVMQSGVGQITITAAGGVAINSAASVVAKTAERWAVAQLIKVGADEWDLYGNLEAAP